MIFNNLGYALLKGWEKLVLWTYDDATGRRVCPGDKVHGTLTIGYGHTGDDVFPGMEWTEEQALDMLAADVEAVIENITPMITTVLNDNQFSALGCLAFNIGEGSFETSSALDRVNENHLDKVPARMRLWCKTHINGRLVKSRGLMRRREAEIVLWNTPMTATTNEGE